MPNGPVGRLGLGSLPTVDLASRVVVDVESAARVRGEPDRASRHRLSAQRVLGPRRGHLVRDHAPRVVVEAYLVHHEQAAGWLGDELAPVGALAVDPDAMSSLGGPRAAALGELAPAGALQDHLGAGLGEGVAAATAQTL